MIHSNVLPTLAIVWTNYFDLSNRTLFVYKYSVVTQGSKWHLIIGEFGELAIRAILLLGEHTVLRLKSINSR